MCNKAGEVDCHGPETEVVDMGLSLPWSQIVGKVRPENIKE